MSKKNARYYSWDYLSQSSSILLLMQENLFVIMFFSHFVDRSIIYNNQLRVELLNIFSCVTPQK